MMRFKTSDEYFDWFFAVHPQTGGAGLLDDFVASGGCGSWLLDWPESEMFSEWLMRYRAGKINIAPAANFDDAPVRMLEGVMIIDAELPAASRTKASKDAN